LVAEARLSRRLNSNNDSLNPLNPQKRLVLHFRETFPPPQMTFPSLAKAGELAANTSETRQTQNCRPETAGSRNL